MVLSPFFNTASNPEPEPQRPDAELDIFPADQQPDAPPPVEPLSPAPPVQQIIRQIKTVLIKVPLCDNPPGLDGTPSFTKAHVNLQLIRSRSATGRNLLHRLWWGLKETGAKLGNGRKLAGLTNPKRQADSSC